MMYLSRLFNNRFSRNFKNEEKTNTPRRGWKDWSGDVSASPAQIVVPTITRKRMIEKSINLVAK